MNSQAIRASLVSLFALVLMITACTPEEPMEGEEEIDTVNLIIGSETITWSVDDTEDPTITLDANSTVTVSAEFRNVEEGENVTEEIQEEDDEHLVCYEVSGANLEIERTDTDGGGLEVGLATTWTVGEASTGTMTLELRHQPGVKDGTCGPGSTDVQVTFDIVIQ
ncbi:MAG: hypothetical protein AAF399_05440 [Bacteroidota bacterium]